MIHREGYGSIFAFAAAAVLMTVFAVSSEDGLVMKILSVSLWSLTLFALYFFRDPERTANGESREIVSPGDGKVIEISQAFEPEFFKAKTQKISIFLNVFNVHVNRCPTDGVVNYFKYKTGRFVRANLADASTENEQTVIGVQNGEEKLVFKQIAGLIARRICCDLREGHKVQRGERMGIIKFGSRVDVFLPLDAEVFVKLGDKVKGGESVIGAFKNVS